MGQESGHSDVEPPNGVAGASSHDRDDRYVVRLGQAGKAGAPGEDDPVLVLVGLESVQVSAGKHQHMVSLLESGAGGLDRGGSATEVLHQRSEPDLPGQLVHQRRYRSIQFQLLKCCERGEDMRSKMLPNRWARPIAVNIRDDLDYYRR